MTISDNPLSLQTNRLNTWFYLAIGTAVIGGLLISYGFVASSGIGQVGKLPLLICTGVSFPFWLLSLGCAICGQIERLIDTQVMLINMSSTVYRAPMSFQPVQAQSIPAQQIQAQLTEQKQCNYCAEPIPANALACPICGNRQ